MLMAKTALHQETLARLGLLRAETDYTKDAKFVSETISESRQTIKSSSMATAKLLMASASHLNPETTIQAANDSNINGLEFFGLIR